MEKLIGQQDLVLYLTEKFDYLVEGVAGSGKTLIAIYKAILMSIQHPNYKIVFLTFNNAIANDNRNKINKIVSYLKSTPIFKDKLKINTLSNLEINTVYKYFKKCVNDLGGYLNPITALSITEEKNIIQEVKNNFSTLHSNLTLPQRSIEFFKDEINWLENTICTKEDYFNHIRKGRKGTHLKYNDRPAVYQLYQDYLNYLKKIKQKYFDIEGIYQYLYLQLCENEIYKENLKKFKKIDYLIIDEYQDFSIAMLKSLQLLMNNEERSHFLLVGDHSQNIFNSVVEPKKIFKNLKIIKLSTIYRNSSEIAKLANAIFNNKNFTVDNDKDSDFNIKPNFQVSRSIHKPYIAIANNIEMINKIENNFKNKYKDTQIILLNKKDNIQNNEKTINQVKGLEYNNVIIPDVDKLPTDKDKDKNEIISEHLHKLYTAVTRAKKNLLLIINSKNKNYINTNLVTFFKEGNN